MNIWKQVASYFFLLAFTVSCQTGPYVTEKKCQTVEEVSLTEDGFDRTLVATNSHSICLVQEPSDTKAENLCPGCSTNDYKRKPF